MGMTTQTKQLNVANLKAEAAEWVTILCDEDAPEIATPDALLGVVVFRHVLETPHRINGQKWESGELDKGPGQRSARLRILKNCREVEALARTAPNSILS